jgi:hypothetical protein
MLNKLKLKNTIYILLVIQIIWIIYISLFIKEYRQLPSPFFSDKNDTFMDFFNPLWWSTKQGIYSEWGSIYPPLNFILLKIIKEFFYPLKNYFNGFEIRGYSLNTLYIIIIAYIFIPMNMLLHKDWSGFNVKEKITLYFIIISSVPYLFAFERGNLIVLCLLFIPTILHSSNIKSALSLALLINIKPYFIILSFGYLISGNINKFFVTMISTISIFVISGLLLCDDFYKLIPNIINFGSARDDISIRAILSMPISLTSYINILDLFVIRKYEYASYIGVIEFISTSLKLANYSLLLLLMYTLAVLKNNLTEMEIMTIIIFAAVYFIESIGSYGLIFYLPLLPYIKQYKFGKVIYGIIILIYAPWDIFSLYRNIDSFGNIYIFNEKNIYIFQITVATFIRPISNYLLLSIFLIGTIFKYKKISIE